MRPQDHPEYFRFAAPEGRSRESTIVLDAEGRFFHHGAPVEHPGMARAFASWIDVHPDDGRFILNNGYDWSYFRVEDAPFFVLGVREQGGQLWLALSDGSESPLEEGTGSTKGALGAAGSAPPLIVGDRDALYTTVKAGKFRARFTPAAQTALAPWLVSDETGQIFLEIAGRRLTLGKFGEAS
ncbi:MAG: hypothetical protein ABI488_08455 [Polyangiaceae bacterium]